MKRFWKRVSVVFLCSAAVAGLAGAPGARASFEPLGSGVTTLKLDKGFLAALRSHGVKIRTREGVTFKGGALRFPVTGGKFDPTNGKGTIEHGGAALLDGVGKPFSLEKLQLKTTRPSSPIAVKVGGGQLKLGPAKRLRVGREGFAEKVTVSGMTLSAKVATRLSKRLKLKGVFEEGMPVGSIVSTASPATVSVLGNGAVSLELDPAIVAKLTDLHVAINPIFPAEHPGPFTMPIFSGNLATDVRSGSLQLQGGLELLQLSGGQVIWSEAVLDLGGGALSPLVEIKPSPPYPGKIGQQAVAVLNLGAGTTSADPGARTLSIGGAALTLTDATAATFNETFAKPQGQQNLFSPGETLGRISFTAGAQ